MNQRVLVVDDEPAMRLALQASFRRHGWDVDTAAGAGEAVQKFTHRASPLVITDMRMPDGDGMEVMRRVRALAPETAILLLTAYANVPEAVAAIKAGACDYLVKPIVFDQLYETALRVLGTDDVDSSSHGALLGDSAAIRDVSRRALQVASSEADVLIEAESGTGKELLARMIHENSQRATRPFVAVNCAALPATLLESELFGHVKGAFTGAVTTRAGRFEQANGGTLLLDEIGEMPAELQPKLLRVLQQRQVDPLGGVRPLAVDVRVIATTNRNLNQLVETGQFRADLYFRLNVVPMTIPPLRDRKGDIPILAEHFLRKYAAPAPGAKPCLSADAMSALQSYDWPGNVRELENAMRRGLAMSGGPVIEAEALGLPTPEPDQPAPGSLRDVEREMLKQALEQTDGNRTRAAELLGISVRTVRNKIRAHGLPPRRRRCA